MKQFICQLETANKTVALNNNNITLINGKVYNEGHPAVAAYPRLFNEVKIIDTPDTHIPLEEVVNIIDEKETNNIITTNNITHNKSSFSWSRLSILGVALALVGFISGYLRVHGISIVFKIDIILSLVLVVGFIVSETAIASLLLREIKSKLHHLINFTVLGIIQIILIVMSFIFEFSTMSNWILTQKNEVSIIDNREQIIKEKIIDIEKQIENVEKQIAITPDSWISKRSRLNTDITNLVNEKNKQREKLEEILNNEDVVDKKVNKTGFETTATIIGVDESTLTKGVLVVIASILNILYLFFIYGFISEWKRRS